MKLLNLNWNSLLLILIIGLGSSFCTKSKPVEELPTVSQILSFEKAIKPIFQKHCVSCHGMIWSKYKNVLENKELIWLKVIIYRDMPKGRSLSELEHQTIRQWFDSGCQE